MAKGEERDDEESRKDFQPLESYQTPTLPTDETFREFLRRTRSLFTKDGNKPFVAEGNLRDSPSQPLDALAAPPAFGPLMAELDSTLSGWLRESDPVHHLKLIVLPPGDDENLLAQWARRHDHQLLAEPQRLSLIRESTPETPDLEGEGLLVIPRLEYWFLRHHGGLRGIRNLLASLQEKRRPCVIGCGSYAWTYLVRSIGADLILPDSMTFQAFDADHLSNWFAKLIPEEGTEKIFRLSQNGKDVFARNGKDELSSDYFAKLAARSLGTPWIAWSMWRSHLRSDRSDEEDSSDDKEIPKSEENTIWVAEENNYHLPQQHRDESLLVMHAILIHGQLTAAELRLVVPIVGESFIVSGLVSSGFLKKDGDFLRCNPLSYPSIRSELKAAGYPLDHF